MNLGNNIIIWFLGFFWGEVGTLNPFFNTIFPGLRQNFAPALWLFVIKLLVPYQCVLCSPSDCEPKRSSLGEQGLVSRHDDVCSKTSKRCRFTLWDRSEILHNNTIVAGPDRWLPLRRHRRAFKRITRSNVVCIAAADGSSTTERTAASRIPLRTMDSTWVCAPQQSKDLSSSKTPWSCYDRHSKDTTRIRSIV